MAPVFASNASGITSARPAAGASALDKVAFVGLLVALVWAPWPLGSNRPWAVALLGALVWAGVVCAALATWGAPRSGRKLATGWVMPLVCLCAFAALAVAQLLPDAAGQPLSIDPIHTRMYLLRTLVYLGAWALVLLTVRDRDRAVQLLAAVLAAGVLQALAAVLLYSAGARYELWFMPFDQGDRAMGTFPNPDHLAGYMEVTLSAGVGWLLSRLQGSKRGARPHWRTRVVSALTFMLSGKMLLRMLLVVLVIALVMTHSRMGNGTLFVALGFVAAMVAWRLPAMRRPALWLVASMALVDVFIIGQWVGLDRVVQRLKHTAEASSPVLAGFGLENVPPPREESLAQRLEVPLASLQLVQQRPWFGHGGGSYYTAFPPVKQRVLPHYWDHAHNDYVQVASDMGLVGLVLWLAIGVASAWRAAQLLHEGESRVNRGVGVAALMALCCMGLHNVVDFNLHIPAIAITFTVLLAAVWAVPPTARPRRRSSRPAVPAE